MDAIVVVLLAACAALILTALVLLFLWRRARKAAATIEFNRSAAERDRIELELLLAEQTSRLRIVRELHELVVQSLSVLISHADGARYAAEKDPAIAARSAAVIADTARDTLSDLRRVMPFAREGEAAAGPQPGLATVRELFEAMTDAGLAVEFLETGDPIDLKQGVELAIYRILQQSLENSLTHGGPGTHVFVRFSWHPTGLEVIVDDDGARSTARREGLDPDEVARQPVPSRDDELAALTQPPIGRGITDMRERAKLYGGVFVATVNPGVGFTVTAVFPAPQEHNGIDGVKSGA